MKVKIHPNRTQMTLFNKLFGAHRYFYNKTAEYITLNELDIKKLNFIDIRKKCLTNDKSMLPSDPELWTREIPYDTRQFAIKKVVDSYKTSNTQKTLGQIRQFGVLAKKEDSQVFYINKKALSVLNGTISIFKRRLKNNCALRINRKQRQWVRKNIKSINHNINISTDSCGNFYLNIFYDRVYKKYQEENRTISLDPGVRTFQTGYSETGCVELGVDFCNRKLHTINNKIDLLETLSPTIVNRHTKKNIRRRCFRLRTKISNCVDNFHWKCVNFLTDHYDTIILPKFNCKQIAMKSNNHKMNRDLYALSHYKFRSKLEARCKILGKQLILCSESWTSKTCGGCGTIQADLGSKKTYNCTQCDICIDRDINGARNILIRCLTKYHDNK